MSSAFAAIRASRDGPPAELARVRANLVRVTVFQVVLAGVAIFLAFFLSGKQAALALALLLLPIGVEIAAALYYCEVKRASAEGLYTRELERAATKRANTRLGLFMAAWVLVSVAVFLLL